MNHRLDGRLRKLENKQAAELDRDREIRLTWVTNGSRGCGLWHESERSPEERTSRYRPDAQPPPVVAVESTTNDVGATCSKEADQQEES